MLTLFVFFDPQKVPSPSNELADYGQDRIEYLRNAYGEGSNPDVDSAECVSECEGLKRLFVNKFSHFTMQKMIKLLCTDTSLQDMYPQLTKLVSIAAIIPVSTAEYERSFSTMNRVKTVLRNCLKTSTLDSLMRIKIEDPPLSQFNFERAADVWGTLRNRRLQVGDSSCIFVFIFIFIYLT